MRLARFAAALTICLLALLGCRGAQIMEAEVEQADAPVVTTRVSPEPAPPGAVATPLPAIAETEERLIESSAADGGIVTMRWRTGREVQVAGYNIMRAETPEGPFLPVNPALIPGAGTSAGPHQYEYTDRNLDPGRVYYYHLEEVLETGQQRPLSETRAFTAKQPD